MKTADQDHGKIKKPTMNITKKLMAAMSTTSEMMKITIMKTPVWMNLNVNKTAAIANPIARMVDHPNQKNIIDRIMQINAAILQGLIVKSFFLILLSINHLNNEEG